MVRFSGMALTHFVKYLVVVMMYLCPSEEWGVIMPTRSKPQHEKGHGGAMGYRFCANAWIKLACC